MKLKTLKKSFFISDDKIIKFTSMVDLLYSQTETNLPKGTWTVKNYKSLEIVWMDLFKTAANEFAKDKPAEIVVQPENAISETTEPSQV